MKNKKYLVLGAGSFLGSSFLDYMMKSNYEIFGVSSFQRNKNIIGSDYSKNSLDNVLRDINPDVVYDFKLSKVSSNQSDFNDSFETMFANNQNIINSLKKYGKNIDLHLISTSKLINNLDTSHPYLKLKKAQEFLYKEDLSAIASLNIHRVENIVGKRDMNFSRILPFFFGSALVNKSVKFSSLSTYRRNYLTVEQFNQNLESIDKTPETNINNNSVPLTNENLISKAKLYFEKMMKIEVPVYWNNGEDSFRHYVNENKLNAEFFLDLQEIAHWYISNEKIVSEEFNKYQGSFSA